MKQMALTLLVIVSLGGCATPPGRLDKTDFEWTEINTDYTYQEAYRRMDAGFKKCGFPIENALFTDNQTAYFYIFLPDMLGGKSAWVLGKVDISAKIPAGSVIEIGVMHKYDKPLFGEPGKIRKAFEKFVQGDYNACN